MNDPRNGIIKAIELKAENERLLNENSGLRALLLGVLYADEDAVAEAKTLFPEEWSVSAPEESADA